MDWTSGTPMHHLLLAAIGVLLLIWPVSRWLHEVRLRKIAQKRLRIARTVTEMEKLGSDPLFTVMFKAQFRDDFPMPRPPGEVAEGERGLADRICAEMGRSGSPAGRLWG